MDFVDDDDLESPQVLAEPFARQHHLKRLRRGDEEIWWPEGLDPSFGLRGITVADGDGDPKLLPPLLEP